MDFPLIFNHSKLDFPFMSSFGSKLFLLEPKENAMYVYTYNIKDMKYPES